SASVSQTQSTLISAISPKRCSLSASALAVRVDAIHPAATIPAPATINNAETQANDVHNAPTTATLITRTARTSRRIIAPPDPRYMSQTGRQQNSKTTGGCGVVGAR